LELQWEPQYIAKYLGVAGRYAHLIEAQLFGHTHKDEFRVHSDLAMPPMRITGAVSVIYSNNPSFGVVDYDRATVEVQDWSVYRAQALHLGASPPVGSKFNSARAAFGMQSAGTTSLGQELLTPMDRMMHDLTPVWSSSGSSSARTLNSADGTSVFGRYWFNKAAGE
jgi:hypothetical protein